MRIAKKNLCKGNKKHEKFSLILLGSDSSAEGHSKILQNHIGSLEKKKLDREAEAYGNEKACPEKWKIDLFWF